MHALLYFSELDHNIQLALGYSFLPKLIFHS